RPSPASRSAGSSRAGSGRQAGAASEPTGSSSRAVIVPSRQASTIVCVLFSYRIGRGRAAPSARGTTPHHELVAGLGLDRVEAGYRGTGRGQRGDGVAAAAG